MNYLLIGSLIFVPFISTSSGRHFEDDLLTTPSELKLVEQLKSEISGSPRFNQKPYLHSTAFLTRWLKANQFDLIKTQQKLSEFLQWREENDFDNWVSDPWIEENFPIRIFLDKEGMPVIFYELTNYKLRESVRMGKENQYMLHYMKTIDKASEMIYDFREQGSNITRFNILANMKGFSYQEHLCPFCLPTYFQVVSQLESYYPHLFDRIIVVNSPPLFNPLLALVYPLMREELQKSFQLYPVEANKKTSTWKDYVDDWIGLEKIPTPNTLL